MLRIAVLGSGRGTNFQSILDAIEQGKIPSARIECVLSNNSSAGILARARDHAVPAYHLTERQFASEEEFCTALLSLLRSCHVNFIVLAGYLKLLPEGVIREFRNRIINIHPALLPKFGGRGMYGIHVHEAVLSSGENESGATVHLVDEAYDRGAIIAQRRVPVLPGDTPESLAARVLEVEHQLYPETLRRFALGLIKLPAQADQSVAS
jgi:phosphoribosylglycinamide formyltransferase-1